MRNDDQVDVIAADVMTGTILDEDLKWFVGSPGQTKWKRTFENRTKAIAFCERQVQLHPDVEYSILATPTKVGDRIVNQKWQR
ncbi:MAG: hypothetical protein SD837_14375 [Candidatus Electrothrix scaldis]|nr:MAG: hypothetical protein SD837_14375 [Candidatus Electrothrix sp. GW3-3]